MVGKKAENGRGEGQERASGWAEAAFVNKITQFLEHVANTFGEFSLSLKNSGKSFDKKNY